jgi:5-methyltetrahydrofolate--homocysteine methyltransferase
MAIIRWQLIEAVEEVYRIFNKIGGNMLDFMELSKAVVEGETELTVDLTRKALDDGIAAKVVLDEGIIPGLKKTGELFENGEYFLPELLISGEAASSALELIEPALSAGNVPSQGKIAIGTVEGDIHNIGKNIVIMMLKGNGWEVTDLGVDISAEEFCSAVKKGDFQILALSALLTMTMPSTVKTIEALKSAGLRGKVKIMVGGAPTTQEWADKIGADGYADDAPGAVRVATALIA